MNDSDVEPTIPNESFNVYTNAIKLITTTCPADMFANKRIINAKGFVNIPSTSIGAKTIFIGTGTPGIQKICPQ